MSRADPTAEQKLDMSIDDLIPVHTNGSGPNGDKAKGNKSAPKGSASNPNASGPNGKTSKPRTNHTQGQSAPSNSQPQSQAPRSDAKKQRTPQPSNNQSGDNNQNETGDNNEEDNNQYGDESYNDSSSRVLKISANSNPKTVAGAISHTSRQGECPSMLATGASSINQAIKALAIARDYLEENKIDISCYPEARPETRNGMLFRLVKTIRRQAAVEKDVQQMKVSKNSKPASVAGAIANKLREGQRVCILAIGADSVLHCVQAISMGRKFLEQDALDISFRPEFTKVQFDESEERIAIKFTVISQQI